MPIEMKEVESSQIHSVGFADGTLHVRFKGRGDKPGSLYQYANCTPDLHAEFLGAESKGAFLGSRIKNARDDDGNPLYPFTRVAEEPAA